MTDLQASLGIHQLKRLQRNALIRKRYWKRYMDAFQDIPEIQLPAPIPKHIVHAYHLFALVLKTETLSISRNRFIEALQAEGVGVGIHFTAIPFHKYYRQKYGLRKSLFPVASYISDRLISLPFYPHMTSEDLEDTIQAVRKLVGYYRKA